MRTCYQYRLRPNQQQIATIEHWLELLRRCYNYRLGERFRWWDENHCDIDCCSLWSCSIAPLKEKPSYCLQANDLPQTKALFPEYKDVYSQALQECVKRVEKAYDRWVKGDSSGKRSGRPRFKGKGRYRSFTYPQMKQDCIQGKFIHLPKIGKVKLILHRPLPAGFKVKTATVTHRADGWYVNLSLEDVSVPESTPDVQPTLDNTVGIDMGLKSFLVTSDAEEVPIPQHYRKAEKRLQRLQRQLSRKKKGSKRTAKAVRRVALTHLKVANKRKDFHYNTANWLLGKGLVVAHEDLNTKGLARTRLAKSINDAGWSQFLQILAVKAERAGRLTVAVNPNGTTQDCSGCGVKVPKELSDRWHSCPICGLEMDRDHNAALIIKLRAVGHPAPARGGLPDGVPGKREAYAVPSGRR